MPREPRKAPPSYAEVMAELEEVPKRVEAMLGRPLEACSIASASSRTCELGTDGCVVRHAKPLVSPKETRDFSKFRKPAIRRRPAPIVVEKSDTAPVADPTFNKDEEAERLATWDEVLP